MKNNNKICILFFILIGINAAGYSQTPDSLGLPGDNLNLYGVLSLFKESQSVEKFEQKLNTPDNKVNNLDLNHDGKTDYIRVVDYGKNGLHSLVLQDPITATESQDLAVIEIEQQGDNNAHVQIIGDEDLYGKNYIIEPQDEQQAQQAPVDNTDYSQSPAVMVNVWGWPSVQFMYGPSYAYWNSPWYWGYYPGWWSPWQPMGYYAYWHGMYGYRAYHHRAYENRIIAAQTIYYGHRQASPIVHINIVSHVYYRPRTIGKMDNAVNTPRKMNGNNSSSATAPRKQTEDNKQISSSQPKQQVIPRQQQSAPKQQVQTAPRQQQQIEPRQQQAQAAPRQQPAMPRQQAAPRNMGGGMHAGGGGGRRR